MLQSGDLIVRLLANYSSVLMRARIALVPA